MKWLNAGISALVAYVFVRLFDLPPFGAACVFLVVFVVLTLTGSSFGGIWNSGLWTTLPARRCLGAVADAAMFIAAAAVSWWLVVDVMDVPVLSYRFLHFLTRGRPEDAQFENYHERDAAHCPELGSLPNRELTAVLDGQQRLTALNIGLRGFQKRKVPKGYPCIRLSNKRHICSGFQTNSR